MSELFSRIPIHRLLSWVLKEYQTHTIFGIHKDLFFIPQGNEQLGMTRYGQHLETPLGVAAGPHTQMAQNIITAWLTGSRFIELKTIQTLDELDISKPCIDMEDEGYNCEWSQELKCEDSFDEYLNAWIIIHVLRHLFKWDHHTSGLIFNMSIGYNMEGILKENVQKFLSNMVDATTEIEHKKKELRGIYPQIDEVQIPTCLSNNVTLSTMHGCPPEEIEEIATYLIRTKKLHTAVKLNPTLLGPQRLRNILNIVHRFPVDVPDQAFAHDLKYPDAVKMIERLLCVAKETGVEFGLKLTNTLETVNSGQTLPESEKMNYLSGRALHPISIHVAKKLQESFNGQLDLSFCGGADCFNVKDIISCGLKPVTVCSDILKPGGYARLKQYLDILLEWDDLAEYLSGKIQTETYSANLKAYSEKVLKNEAYTKTPYSYETIKTNRELTSFDCIAAPCEATCPSHQEIPQYMRAVASGDFDKAHDIIMKTNPFPGVTGLVCDHICQTKCTRLNIDTPLLIREIKRFAEEFHTQETQPSSRPKHGAKAAVIGAGPSGLTAAYYLYLNGFDVDVYEARGDAGGMVSGAIPMFRLTEKSIETDIERITRLGVKIHYNSVITRSSFLELQNQHDCVYISIGAAKAKKLGLEGDDAEGVLDQITFLSELRKGVSLLKGKHIVVMGGGNSAMDASRTANRLIPPDGKVTVIYRRTTNEMPAEVEEIEALAQEGIELIELTAPARLQIHEGKLQSLFCHRMKLGEKDASGRCRPIKIEGSEFEIKADTLISAFGQDVDLDFIDIQKVHEDTLETDVQHVYMGGDAFRGASTVIRAIADGITAAESMIKKYGVRFNEIDRNEKAAHDKASQQKHTSNRTFAIPPQELALSDRKNFKLVRDVLNRESAIEEASRCLSCDLICDVCVTVCPNRANLSYTVETGSFSIPELVQSNETVCKSKTVEISQEHQIINIGDFCNECGNCTTFCPTSGNPYKDKPKFYLTRSSFDPESSGFYLEGNTLEAKYNGSLAKLIDLGDEFRYETDDVTVHLVKNDLKVKEYRFKRQIKSSISLERAIEMCVMYKSLQDNPFVG